MRPKARNSNKNLCTFISCSNTCQMHQNKHAGSLSNQQPAGLMQCTCQQTHSSIWVFSTVPNSLVVSGDSTSSAGFSSGTSGLGYLDAITSFQKQNSNQSLFKNFQSILEHPPARSFINIKTGFLWVLHQFHLIFCRVFSAKKKTIRLSFCI